MAAEAIQPRRSLFGYWIGTTLLVLLAAILAGLLPRLRQAHSFLPVQIQQLPMDAVWSLWRMAAAYVLSLGFAISVGMYAASQPKAAKLIIPILDILQSIPIVTFFPAALAVAFHLFGGGRFGFEIAAIVLIFTSMAWNMAFSVYDSVRAIPRDSIECAQSFGVRGGQRFFAITLPACIPGLLYNSILSWTAGWFALTACEMLTVGSQTKSLPGLGSFIAEAANDPHHLRDSIIGVAALFIVVSGLEFFLWRPLGVWAERFRYEMSVSSVTHDTRGIMGWYRYGLIPRLFVRYLISPLNGLANFVFRRLQGSAKRIVMPRIETPGLLVRIWAATNRFLGWGIALAIALGGVYYIAQSIRGNFPSLAWWIPEWIGLSFLRIVMAYVLSLLWTIPLVLWASRHPRALKGISSAAQILGSLPAISLTFIAVSIFVIHLHLGSHWGVEAAGLMLLMNGVQWYVLFNMLGGVSKIPGDLLEACNAMGLTPWLKFRRLLLPAMLPSLLTGTVTAFGGGWNTLIFSESIFYAGKYYWVPGIGWLLDVASNQARPPHGIVLTPGDRTTLLLLGVGCLIIFIVVVNRLVWKRLQAWAADRFRLDY